MEINGRTISISNPDNWLTENSPVDSPSFVKTRTLANGEQPSDYREIDTHSIEAVRRMAAIRRSSRGNRIEEYVRHGTISIYSPVGHVYMYNGVVALPLTIKDELREQVFAFDLMPFRSFIREGRVDIGGSAHFMADRMLDLSEVEYNPENSILKVTFTPDKQFLEDLYSRDLRLFATLDYNADKFPVCLHNDGSFSGLDVDRSTQLGYRIRPLQITEETIRDMFANPERYNGYWTIQKLRRRRIWRGEGVVPKRFSKWSGRWDMTGTKPEHYTGVFRIRKRMANGDWSGWVRFSSYLGEKIRIF